jgi:hypothetical protein
MRKRTFWLGIIALSVGVAFGFALALALAGAAVAFAAGEPQSAEVNAPSPAPQSQSVLAPDDRTDPVLYTGMITDSFCGARHSASLHKSAADCTRACVRSGKEYFLVDGDRAYILQGDSATVGKFAGQRSQVAGTLTGNLLKVSSIASGT